MGFALCVVMSPRMSRVMSGPCPRQAGDLCQRGLARAGFLRFGRIDGKGPKASALLRPRSAPYGVSHQYIEAWNVQACFLSRPKWAGGGVGGAMVDGGDVHMKCDGGTPTDCVTKLSGSPRGKGGEERTKKVILGGKMIQKRPKKGGFGNRVFWHVQPERHGESELGLAVRILTSPVLPSLKSRPSPRRRTVTT